eukprot:260623-Prorocentrum_minimum.AAC.1
MHPVSHRARRGHCIFSSPFCDWCPLRVYYLSPCPIGAHCGLKGLDAGTAELTVKTLSSHLVTRKFNSPTSSVRTPLAGEDKPRFRKRPAKSPCGRCRCGGGVTEGGRNRPFFVDFLCWFVNTDLRNGRGSVDTEARLFSTPSPGGSS